MVAQLKPDEIKLPIFPRSDREAELYEAGFWSKFEGKEYDGPVLKRRNLMLFLSGELAAESIFSELNAKQLRQAKEDWKQIHERAVELRRRRIREAQIAKRSRKEIEDLIPALEPCATCELAGVCKKTGRTCQLFRAYVGSGAGRSRVPDLTWDESFQSGKD